MDEWCGVGGGPPPAHVSTVLNTGRTPAASRMLRTSASSHPRSCAIWASEKPCSFAKRRMSTARGGGWGMPNLLGDLVDEHDLVKEPRVDFCRLKRLLNGRTQAQRLLYEHDPPIGRGCRKLQKPGCVARLWPPVEGGTPLLQRPQRLLQRRREVASDRHGLPHRLHRRRERRISGRELLERKPGYLHDHVVECWLKRG